MLRLLALPAVAGTLALAVVTAGCGGSSAADEGGRLKVVATTTQVADFTRNIGGDRISLTQILRPNVDPHDFEPSPAELKKMNEAAVVIENGVGLEAWLDDTIRNSGFDGDRIDTSRGISVRTSAEDDEHGASDPHIWQDPRNVMVMVRTIAAALSAADPDGAATYQRNLATYTGKLAALDKEVAARIATIPAGQRTLVTNHDALGYYVDRYGLTFVGSIIPSFDTSAELSKKDIDEVVGKIRATGVKAIFSESSMSPDTARTIAREAGVDVISGEDSLYADTLGPEGSPGATYLDMVRHNTDVIVGALS